MDIAFSCPICHESLVLDESCIGKRGQCPFCNSVFVFTNALALANRGDEQSKSAERSGAENVSPPYSDHSKDNLVVPVGFWARVVATLVDAIASFLIVLFVAVLAGVVIAALGTVDDARFYGRWIGIVTEWLYAALMESSGVQATLGKLVIGAKVVDASGQRISFGRATGRHFAKYLSALVLGVGYVMVAFDKRKQGLHDMLAGTFVVARH